MFVLKCSFVKCVVKFNKKYVRKIKRIKIIYTFKKTLKMTKTNKIAKPLVKFKMKTIQKLKNDSKYL